MESKPIELLMRAKNFRIDFSEEMMAEEEFTFFPYYSILYELKENMFDDFQKNKLDKPEILSRVFSKVFHCTKIYFRSFSDCTLDESIHRHIYEACLFTTLSSFLHSSKRIKGKRLLEFVYDYSLFSYKDPDSQFFCPLENSSDILNGEVSTLRKSRNRVLSDRPVYFRRNEWSAMSLDSEHEWSLYFLWDQGVGTENNEEALRALHDTYKRIGNLYKDINKQLASPKDEGFQERLGAAYQKFLSKLKKLRYENYLNLQKRIIEHICADKTYYGMNIYRLERLLRPYILTNEVRCLLDCNSDAEKDLLLRKTLILSELRFPKLYKDFFDLRMVTETETCAMEFSAFLSRIVWAGCLIFDELIEKGFLGEIGEWTSLFLHTVNEMTESVFYSPDEIDYTVTSGSQEAFMNILTAPALHLLMLNGWHPFEKQNTEDK